MVQRNKLLFLCFAVNFAGEASHKFSNPKLISSASSRLQLLPLINAAQNSGLSTTVWSLHSEKPEHLNQVIELEGVKGLIIGKMSSNTKSSIDSMIMANSAAIYFLKSKNIPITLMYSDHHLIKNDSIGVFYRSILSYVDTFITPSNSLKQELIKYTKRKLKIHVVKDPWQTPRLPFKKTKSIQNTVNLIWFGSGSNIDYLIRELPSIISNCHSSSHYNLTILTRKEIINYFKSSMPKSVATRKKWSIHYEEWSDSNHQDQFLKNLSNSHLAIIPSDPSDPKKLGVSHNRLVDSIQCGCIAIASQLNSYTELSNMSLLGDNFPEMIDFAINNYDYLCEKFDANREDSLAEFNPSENIKRWEEITPSLIAG